MRKGYYYSETFKANGEQAVICGLRGIAAELRAIHLKSTPPHLNAALKQ